MSISGIPPYFTWVVDRLLAISSTPYHHSHLNYLINNRIHTVVSFLDQPQPPYHTNPLLKVIPYSAGANLQQSDCDSFVSLIEESKQRGEAILVHGAKGVDIAGVLVACYLVKKWECPADFAIGYLRGIMPSCIENKNQERLVYEYHDRQFKKIYSDFYPSKVEFLGKSLETEEPYPNRTLNAYNYE